MHEHGIADKLMNQTLFMAKQKGIDPIKKIIIGVGVLSGIEKENLLEPLEHVAEHCDLKDVEFVFEKVLPSANCRVCNIDIGQEYVCPTCSGSDIEITGGLDVVVLKVE